MDLKDLAKRTRNYSGAELEGLIRKAVGYKLFKSDKIMDFENEAKIDPND